MKVYPKTFKVLDVVKGKYNHITALKRATLQIVSFGKLSYLLFDNKIWIKEFNKQITYLESKNVYHLESKVGLFVLADV